MNPEAPKESPLLKMLAEYRLVFTEFEWTKEPTPVVPGKVYKIGPGYWLYTQAGNWQKLDGKVFD
jgi:hypothetical protein